MRKEKVTNHQESFQNEINSSKNSPFYEADKKAIYLRRFDMFSGLLPYVEKKLKNPELHQNKQNMEYQKHILGDLDKYQDKMM